MAATASKLFIILLCAVSTFANSTKDSVICKSCVCSELNGHSNLIEVDCSYNKLTDVPQNAHLPMHTVDLKLKNNNIKILPKLEANNELQYFDLSANTLEKIDYIPFEHTPNLIFIDLSYNHLVNIPETIFEYLDELQFLNLSHNRIEYLPFALFKQCTSLTELRLSNNPLKHLDLNLFANTHQLEILYMSHNQLLSISADLFHPLNKLMYLDISDNEFQRVPSNALRMASNLEILDLSKNPIKVLNEASFHKLHSLRELIMDRMPALYEIDKKTFSDLFNLQKLYIRDCPHLVYIDPYAFMNAFNHSWIAMKEVSFYSNRLTTLSEITLPFCNLTMLDLRENPWNCNCHLHWIKYCHGSKNFEKGILCATPDVHRGQELQLISHENLVCPVESKETSFFKYSTFVLIGIALLLLFVYRKQISDLIANKRKSGSIYYVRANNSQMDGP